MNDNESKPIDPELLKDVEMLVDTFENFKARLSPDQIKVISEFSFSARDDFRKLAAEVNEIKFQREQEERRKQVEESSIEFNEAQMDFIEKQTAFLKEQSTFMWNQENREVERLERDAEREGRESKRDKRDNTIKWSTIVMAFATAIIAAGTILPYTCSKAVPTIQPPPQPAPQVLSQATKSKEPSATTDTVVRKPLPPNRVP